MWLRFIILKYLYYFPITTPKYLLIHYKRYIMIGHPLAPSSPALIDDIGIYLCSMDDSVDMRCKPKEEGVARGRKPIMPKPK